MKDVNAEYYIGIDIGTTSIKTVVYDESFNICFHVSKRYNYTATEDGWREIDPTIWSTIVLEQLAEIFSNFPYQKIEAIGVTGQMHTTVFLDQAQQPVRPAIMWNDERTIDVVKKIKTELPKNSQTENILAIVSTGSPLANLIWLKQFEPEHYERLGKILIAKDYVRLILTGELFTDYCDASTSSLYNVTTEQWSEEVLSTFQLSEKILPEVGYASSRAGTLDLSLFDIEGKKGIPVVVGTGDNVASAIANQNQQVQQPIISLGTSGVVILSNRCNERLTTGKNILAKIAKEDQRVITQGALQSGAKVIEWWSENIIQQDITQFEARLTTKLGENQVIFFPYLNGDKTLFKESKLSGAFFGIDLNSEQDDFSLAVYEGTAFAIKRLMQQMRPLQKNDKCLLIGGGAKSQLWPQIFANVLNCVIQINCTAREANCGAAMLAYYHCHQRYPVLPNELREYEPEEILVKKYQNNYQAFITYSDALIKKERSENDEA